jgi:hypothetical protein
MLNVIIPDNNIPERKYIIEIMLSDFLGLEYILTISNKVQDYFLIFDDKKLIILDSFFGLYPEDLSYLTVDAIPKSITFASNKYKTDNIIPVIYGKDEIQYAGNELRCGIDIFASAFFMLARWEEYVKTNRDKHNRFISNESVAFINGFLSRPVVNEYVELLWDFFKELHFHGDRRIKSFDLVLTHDIDHLDYPVTGRIILGDLLKRKSIKLAIKHSRSFLTSHSNPYDTLDFIMTESEKRGLQSHFYFMASNSGQTQDLTFYLKGRRFKKSIVQIKTRGHIIGFHPGYFTYDDIDRWSHEKNLLEEAIEERVYEGRQHYLRFDMPATYCIWEKNRMSIDSTMGYAEHEGFRCGTGDVFTVFNFLERKKMNLKERPLIIMDGSLRKYSLEEALKAVNFFFSVARKYNSTLTLLFHNSTFYGDGWEGYNVLYQEILSL